MTTLYIPDEAPAPSDEFAYLRRQPNARGWRIANVFAVPGTGRFRRGHMFRRPRHAAVLRALGGNLRGEKLPPTDWDDINVGSFGDRCWKRHRAHRWHEARQ